jgi:sugar phosphate isomerase/epimerase
MLCRNPRLEGDTMTNTNTVGLLHQEMQGAQKLGRPLVGCSGWPNPAEADPPELRRKLNETDLKRAVELARRRGIANGYIVAVWNAAKATNPAGENKTWIADFIYTLDNLPPGDQPVTSK